MAGTDQCPVCNTDRIPSLDLDTLADLPAFAALAQATAAGEPPPEATVAPSAPEADSAEDLPTAPAAEGRPPFELRARYTGRSAVQDRLTAAVDRARQSNNACFLAIIGEPGMGKSRTVKELARTLRHSHADVRFLAGAADGSSILYAPFGRLLASRFGITPSDPPDVSHQKITSGVGEVMPAARVTETAHLIAHLMRMPFPDSPIVAPLAETPQQLEARTFLALRRFLAADAAAGPLILCFEDLEACEAESINLLHYLVAGLSQSPVIIMGTGRESLYQRHPSFGDVDVALERIDLGPLSDKESEDLLRELCRPLERLPDRLVAHSRKLGGSPRALFELVRYLVESGLVTPSGPTAWGIDELALGRATLPETHEALVGARVRIMPAEDRDILEMAAVIGESFWIDGVVAQLRVRDIRTTDPDGPTLGQIAAAGDQTRASSAQTLARLVEREWVQEVEASSVPGEHEYRFAYPYLWSAVYDAIEPERRREFHRVAAQYLELRPEGRAALAQEDVGHHLELAGDAVGAAARYRRTADFARSHFFNERAIRLYSQALACLGEADLAARIHLWHDLGSVYELKGDYEAALGGFERMLRLAWVCASRTKAAVAFNKIGRVWRRKGDLKLALEYLERGLELFEQADDQRGIAGSLDDIGAVLYLLGRYDEAHDKVTEGLRRRGRGGDKRSIAHSLSNLGNIEKDRGKLAASLACHVEALQIRRTIGDRVGVVGSLNNLAVLAYERGDHAEARQGWEQALTEAEETGALPLQALALCNLGELALREERVEEARRRLEEALDIAQEIDDRRLEIEATRNLAILEHTAGEAARAQQLAQRAYQIAASAGLRDNEGRALLTLAQVFAVGGTDEAETTMDRQRPGEPAVADAYFSRGVDLLRQIGNQSELARALERYGRYKLSHGEVEAGVGLLREALVLFSKLGMMERREIEKIVGSLPA